MITGIVWNTEAVMARYRALKASGLSGLEASRQLKGPHWHLLGSRCEHCGFLTLPNRFYIKGHDAKGEVIQRSQAEAEKAYLEVYGNPENRTETNKRTVRRTEMPFRKTTKPSRPAGRPKKWVSEAERLKAYRGRRS